MSRVKQLGNAKEVLVLVLIPLRAAITGGLRQPGTSRGVLLAMLLLQCGLASNAAEPAKSMSLTWPPRTGPGVVITFEDNQHIGLANRHVAVVFRKKNGTPAGIWPHRGENTLAQGTDTSLWSLEMLPTQGAKPVALDCRAACKVTLGATGDPLARKIELAFELAEGIVRAEVELSQDSPRPRWRLAAKLIRGSLWSVTYPQLAVAALDSQSAENELLIPRRRGTATAYGRQAPRFDVSQPYPGPAAKFQFLAAYGKTSGRGFYYAAEDGDSYSKVFIERNYPAVNAVVLAIQHLPEDRGRQVPSFRTPYDVIAGPFHGDWWHAARIYRDWWTKQVWASKGLLIERQDVPGWLKQAPLVLRPSTTKPARTLAANLRTITAVSELFSPQPLFGIWYGWPQSPWQAKGLDDGGHGRVLPPQAGLTDAVRELRKRGVYLQAYVQSVIYNARLADDDTQAASQAVTRDQQGKAVTYGAGKDPHLLAMCRATEWWQARLVEICRSAVGEVGFSGVYLDSFGKGAAECFAPGHGHPIGGGKTVIGGQREMARRIRQAIRSVNPEAIMSGEDPIEAFRDLLDVNLYAVNISAVYRPIYRTVWGDYSLGHGRVLAWLPSVDTLIAETAMLFLEGTIPGRIYCDGDFPLLHPEYSKELEYLKRLVHYTQQNLNYLRFGEYLHPLSLTPQPPTFSFTDSVEKQRVELPAVVHSVTRSHRDGSVAIALVNIGPQPYKGHLPIDPALRADGVIKTNPLATLLQMDEQGPETVLRTGQSKWSQPIELPPREALLLILR